MRDLLECIRRRPDREELTKMWSPIHNGGDREKGESERERERERERDFVFLGKFT